jgi:hypothetical protein
MLYDPKWGSPPVMPTTVAEVLQGLVAWLEGKPGGTTYPWIDPEDCLFARYSRSLGNSERCYLELYRIVGEMYSSHGPLSKIESKVAFVSPHTYAAALQRARALL